MAPPAAAAALLDQIVEEILLRVPPDDPARLLRAALVCKHWARLLADRGFRRRYRERHGGPPPLLGVLANLIATGGSARFVPTLAFSPARASHRNNYRAHDARHGRVLLNRITWGRGGGLGHGQEYALAVWDPVTDEYQPLPLLLRPQRPSRCRAGTPPCSAPAPPPPAATTSTAAAPATSSSSSSASTPTRCPPISSQSQTTISTTRCPEALSHGTHSTSCSRGVGYGHTRCSSTIWLRASWIWSLYPTKQAHARRLMAMEDGGLGFAEVDSRFTLKLWSMETGPDGIEGKWAVIGAIDLNNTQLPAPALGAPPCVVAFADVVGVIFLKTTDGLYTFDLKTGKSIRVMTDDFYDIVPYVSFYTPVLQVASTGVGPSGGASTA